MARARAIDPNIENARALREPWIQKHPEYCKAVEAHEQASQAALNPVWVDDPATFVARAQAARRDREAAEAELAKTRLALEARFDQDMGTA